MCSFKSFADEASLRRTSNRSIKIIKPTENKRGISISRNVRVSERERERVCVHV